MRGVHRIAAACVMALVSNSHAQDAQNPHLHLVLDEDFEHQSSLNPAIWGTGTQPWGKQESNACTLIRAKDTFLTAAGLVNRTTHDPSARDSGKAYAYTDGVSWLRPGYWLTYGYVEIRAKYPVAQGAWPAFWMLRRGWPPEFDVAEFRGAPKSYMTLAFDNEAAQWDTTKVPDNGDTFSGWHTYGLDWEPESLTFTIDGKLIKKHIGPDVPNTAMYVILSGGVDCQDAGSAGFPNYFTVAYLHWYQRSYDELPGAATHVIARQSAGSITISWDQPVGSPTSYVVRYTPTGKPTKTVAVITHPLPTAVTIRGRRARTQGTYTVAAVYRAGEGPTSDAQFAADATSATP